VEQTETPEMLKERNDSSRGKKDKVVAREMCSIMSKGTRTYCHLDDLSVFDAEGGQGSSLLICVKERLSAVQREDDSNDDSDGDNTEMVPEYGICCVDTVIGTITLAQFQDDTQRSRLRTLLTSLTPTEVLLEAGHHTAETAGTLRLVAPRAAIEVLRGEEMPEADEVVKRLHEGKYFPNKAVGAADGAEGSWPHILQAVTGGLGDGSSNLVMCAIGGAVWQLKRSLIDFEVVSMGSFVGYVPPDEDVYQSSQQIEEKDSAGGKSKANLFQTIQSSGGLLASSEETSSSSEGQLNGTLSRMVLDAVALTNLEVLQNNFDRSEKGSLWAFLNRCKTLFGARLLKDWVCHPLFKVPDIKSRTAAVDDLLTSLKSEADKARAVLKSVPDLERLLARVHSLGLKKKGMGSEDHPDSRAVMYEMPIYNSRKIRDFSDVLTGFESVLKIAAIFENSKVTSPVLTKIVKSSAACPTGKFPGEKMDSLLRYFRTIFDEKQAKKDGNIRPLRGVVQEYDQAKDDIAETERNLESYLREMKIKTKINDLKFWGTNKDRFQIEVPIAASNKVPSG
jgi:DNA mismatch repair protein MSH6